MTLVKIPRQLWILGAIILWQVMKNLGQKTTGGQTLMIDKKAFVDRLRPIALAVEKEIGIKADLGVAQSAHESAWGTSGLTQKANNLFGFTAEIGTYWRTQNKPYVDMPTTEWKDGKAYATKRPFRAYASWEESYRDWARLISQTERYKDAFSAARRGDLKGFADALNKAGYATDPKYGDKLVGVFNALPKVA